ncbi:TPA: hypothetical protein DEP94_01350 [Candidatus Nomurabacteria bacterium]|nr:hypothetical protein [Candidatus Nomurabacteria bacterium]
MDFWLTTTAVVVKNPVFILTSDDEEKMKKITLLAEPSIEKQNSPSRAILFFKLAPRVAKKSKLLCVGIERKTGLLKSISKIGLIYF